MAASDLHVRAADVPGFRGALGALHMRDVHLTGSDGFRGSLRFVTIDGVRLGRLRASPHQAHTPAITHDGGEVVFIYQARGISHFTYSGQHTRLGAGDFLIFRPDGGYGTEFDSTCERIAITMPPGWLPPARTKLDTMLPLRVPSDPLTRVVGRIVAGIESEAATIPAAYRSRVASHAVDSLDTIARRALSDVDGGDEHAHRLSEALAYIDAHLLDHDLSAESIAHDLFVSVRTLYATFAAHGLSIATTIRSRRLDMCRRDLSDPLLDHLSLAQVGARWGFGSPSHFATSFRQEFGATPGEYRRSRDGSATPTR